MRIRVDSIKENGLNLDFCEELDSYPALAEIGSDTEFVAPLHIQLRMMRIQELVEVAGKVESRVRFSCSRCLGSFESPLIVPFELTFARELPEPSEESEEDEVELDAEELGLIPFHGEELDLREGIQEQVLMSLPLQPLCRTGCRGLCPQCGADLNQSACDCSQPAFRNKFGSLSGFKVEKDGDQ